MEVSLEVTCEAKMNFQHQFTFSYSHPMYFLLTNLTAQVSEVKSALADLEVPKYNGTQILLTNGRKACYVPQHQPVEYPLCNELINTN
jgi:hypothetical protein